MGKWWKTDWLEFSKNSSFFKLKPTPGKLVDGQTIPNLAKNSKLVSSSLELLGVLSLGILLHVL